MDSIQRVEDSLYQAEQLAIYRAAELERMEGFIADYYVALENRGYFQAHNWYADEVDQWINKKDLTPDKINENGMMSWIVIIPINDLGFDSIRLPLTALKME